MADISQIKLPGDELGRNIKALKLPYGECSTAAATAAKTVTIKTDNNSSNSNNMPFVLEKGVVVLIRFTVTNTAAVANLTLSVNGTTAKGIKYRNANLSAAGALAANRTYIFTYDGTYWQIIGDLDTNTDIKVRQTLSSNNTNRPLLMSYDSTSSSTTDVDNVVYRNNSIYANASTGKITAATFAGELDGTISSSTTATTQTQGDNSTKVATTAYVDKAISDLPEPMIFKGTLGTGGTITSLPSAATANEGYTYKVITAGTYASQSAEVGDVFVSNGSEWVLIPAGDDTDTWRNIKVNGTERFDNTISSGAVDFVDGTGTSANYTASGKKISYSVVYGTSPNTACQGNDSRLSDARTPTSHTHGNIQNGGTLQTTDITIGNGDKLIVTDSTNSNKIARTSLTFDGATTTKCLTQKGTWETFTSNTGTVTNVSISAGTGMNVTGSPISTTGTITVTNTAPHVAGKNIVGATSAATSDATTATTNTTTFLNHVEDTTVKSYTQVKGAGGTTVAAKNGVVTITGLSIGTTATTAMAGNTVVNTVSLSNYAPSTSKTCYLPFTSSTTDGNATLVYNSGIKCNVSVPTTSGSVGTAYMFLGNALSSGSEGNQRGMIRLYSDDSGFGNILQTATSVNVTNRLPAIGGTLLNDVTTTFTSTFTSGTEVGTLTINNVSYTLYAPTPTVSGTVLYLNSADVPS